VGSAEVRWRRSIRSTAGRAVARRPCPRSGSWGAGPGKGRSAGRPASGRRPRPAGTGRNGPVAGGRGPLPVRCGARPIAGHALGSRPRPTTPHASRSTPADDLREATRTGQGARSRPPPMPSAADRPTAMSGPADSWAGGPPAVKRGEAHPGRTGSAADGGSKTTRRHGTAVAGSAGSPARALACLDGPKRGSRGRPDTCMGRRPPSPGAWGTSPGPGGFSGRSRAAGPSRVRS
jgi:hypothetical protein